MTAEAELSWKLADYQRHGIEPPSRLLNMPDACEGELMTDDEVEAYINDAMAALMILHDRGSERFATVQAAFFADLEYLVSIERLDVEDLAEIKKPENYSF